MDIDAATIWLATRDENALRQAKALGVSDRLLNGNAKTAWEFVNKYQQDYDSLPSLGIIVENSGCIIKPPDEEDRVSMDYLVDRLYDRHEFRSIQFGLGKSHEALENGDQPESRDQILKLADHLRSDKAAQLQVHTLSDVAPEVLEMYERVKRGETGVPFPWQTMTDMTLGMWPGTLTFFVARPGVGKCVHEDTLIVDPALGVPRTIREVYEGGPADHVGVTTWSKGRGVHNELITAKVDTGRKECFRFVTRSGRSITVTPEHPFLTPEGWKRADEMKAGVTLASPAKMPFPLSPMLMDGAELDTLAILLSEGSYSGNHVGFSTTDPAVLRIAANAAEYLNVDLTHRSGCDYDFVRRGTGKHPVRELLRRVGGNEKIAKEKVIPDEVFRLHKRQLARFLTIFWMCDGTVSKRGDATITLASEVMVRQLQSLLLRFGVQSRVAYRKIKGGFDAWRLRVYSHCLGAFSSSLSLWGQKAERAELPIARNPNVGSPRLSDAGAEKLRELSGSAAGRWRGGLHEKVAERLGRSGFNTRDLFGEYNAVKMTAFRGFAAVYGVEDEYRWWWDSDIFWDEVGSIEPVGEQKVYDLTVEPTSCFVANDLIVHNTWTAVLMAMHAWEKGARKILLVSPELGRIEMGERMVSKYGEFSYKDMVGATLGDLAEKNLRKVVEELHGGAGDKLHILDDEDKLQPDYIEQAIDAVEPDLVLIDSLYMLKVEKGNVKSGAGSKGDRMERVVETINWMRQLSRRKRSWAPNGLPVVGIHQLSRNAKVSSEAAQALKAGRGTGGMEDAVALSDALYWNAHNLFAMFQDSYMRQDKQLMYVPLKARRQAKISSLVIRWDMETMDFGELGTKVSDDQGYEDKDGDEVPY